MKKQTILPGTGFNNIKFGMTQKEIVTVLGEPDEIEEQVYGEGEDANVYFYDDLGVSMSFDSEEGYKLVEISFESNRFILNNNIEVGMSKDAFLAEAVSLGNYETENLADDGFPEKELFTFEDQNINIWMDNNVVDSIQIGPNWKDDDNIDWPK